MACVNRPLKIGRFPAKAKAMLLKRGISHILVFAAALMTWPTAALPVPENVRVDMSYVAKLAAKRAKKPFHSPKGDLPDFLRKLDYDTYRNIAFRHERALWYDEKLPFRIEFFHPGYLYQEPVHMNEASQTYTRPIRFVQDFFEYRHMQLPQAVPASTGYAGFRILYPLNAPAKWDELGAFIGASYFRLLGTGQSYGLSARGLALDCGETDRPEEFPLWTDWWLTKPTSGERSIRLFAILDSVSCAGAYEFFITPGMTTIAQVNATVFFRDDALVREADPQHKPLDTIGMAPLTSMFWFGENSERKFDDYRPEVHDSDGLLMRLEGDEMVWRPLNNPAVMQHQKFSAKHLQGFGLLQRDRNFASYQDLFNPYQNTPSVWVQPAFDQGGVNNWDNGELHLVELSTQYEGLDNVVAFWSPTNKPPPNQPFTFSYTLYWTRETDLALSTNEVVSTRVGVDPRNAGLREFLIDYDIPKITSEDQPPKAVASCSANATIAEVQVFRNPFEKTWRTVLKMEPKDGNKDPVDLRCTLQAGGQPVSETWSYHWSPP